MLGFDRNQWIAIHINISLLMLVVAALHLYLNWVVFRGYIQRMATRGVQLKQETLLAVLFTALVIAGACLDLPPFRGHELSVPDEGVLGSGSGDSATEPPRQ